MIVKQIRTIECGVFLVAMLCATVATGAQVSTPARPYDEPLHPGAVKDFNFPDPDRPWGHPRQLDPQRRYYVRWDRTGHWDRGVAQPRYYYDAYSYRFGAPSVDDAVAVDLERAYRQGAEDGRNYERFQIQAERGLSAYERTLVEGDRAFREGDYSAAARNYILASKLNQGDPVARLNAVHAHVALGLYEPAVNFLRRAFELEPRIAYLPLNIRDGYGRAEDFSAHLSSLQAAADQRPQDSDLNMLLGYMAHFSGNGSTAMVALNRAAFVQPNDRVIAALREVATLTRPQTTTVKRVRT